MATNIPPSDVIEGLIIGDEETYISLFREYYVSLCSYSRRFVGRRDFAEEIVSETFFKIWENRAKIKITTSVKSYLFQAVNNNSLLYLRKLKNQKILDDYFQDTDYENIGFSDIPDESEESFLAIENISEKIEEAVSQLPQQQQKAFRLKRFDGKKNREIAQIMELSVKTVEMHLAKATLNLRQSLKDYLPSFLLFLFLN
jgi:RNA polymerase sigma-70 factor (ECF subfamily)